MPQWEQITDLRQDESGVEVTVQTAEGSISTRYNNDKYTQEELDSIYEQYRDVGLNIRWLERSDSLVENPIGMNNIFDTPGGGFNQPGDMYRNLWISLQHSGHDTGFSAGHDVLI